MPAEIKKGIDFCLPSFVVPPGRDSYRENQGHTKQGKVQVTFVKFRDIKPGSGSSSGFSFF